MSSSSAAARSEEHTSELQSQSNLVCRLLLEKNKSLVAAATTTASTGVYDQQRYHDGDREQSADDPERSARKCHRKPPFAPSTTDSRRKRFATIGPTCRPS